MSVAAGPYLAACLLLVAAGVAKARRPEPARRALATVLGRRSAGLPEAAVRAAGIAEATLGAAAVLTGTAGAATLVAATYLVFAAFTVQSRRAGAEAGCGCFGAGDDVATDWSHVAVNLAAACAAVVIAGGQGPHTATATERVLVTAAAAGLAYATYQLLVPLPRLRAAIRLARPR